MHCSASCVNWESEATSHTACVHFSERPHDFQRLSPSLTDLKEQVHNVVAEKLLLGAIWTSCDQTRNPEVSFSTAFSTASSRCCAMSLLCCSVRSWQRVGMPLTCHHTVIYTDVNKQRKTPFTTKASSLTYALSADRNLENHFVRAEFSPMCWKQGRLQYQARAHYQTHQHTH